MFVLAHVRDPTLLIDMPLLKNKPNKIFKSHRIFNLFKIDSFRIKIFEKGIRFYWEGCREAILKGIK